MSSHAAGYVPAPPTDFVLPFDLPNAGLRGRIARLDRVSSRALSAHPLPEAAQRVLAEALVLSVLLGSALKLEGRLSVQTKSDGPLSFLVADYLAGGGLRGYARVDQARTGAMAADTEYGSIMGEGAFAVTIQPKSGAQSYQGLVPLSPVGLAASAELYFAQSEQIPTMLKLAAGPIYRAGEGGGWCAGGLMVQAVPEKLPGGVRQADDWQRIALFLETLEAYELLDSTVAPESVLWRLFHEDEVRVHKAQELSFRCTCNEDRLHSVLEAYPRSELVDLGDADGIIRTRCEFCGARYEFPLESLTA